MTHLKLVASLFFFISAFSLFGAINAHGRGGNVLVGIIGGGLSGTLPGLIFGGGLRGWKLLDMLSPPNASSEESGQG